MLFCVRESEVALWGGGLLMFLVFVYKYKNPFKGWVEGWSASPGFLVDFQSSVSLPRDFVTGSTSSQESSKSRGHHSCSFLLEPSLSEDLIPKICICCTWSMMQIFSVSATAPCHGQFSVIDHPFIHLTLVVLLEAALATRVYTPMVMATLGHSPVLISHSAKVAHVLLMRWLYHSLITCEFFLPLPSYIRIPVFQENVCICLNYSWIFCDTNLWIWTLERD